MLYSMYKSDYYDASSLIGMMITITIQAIICLLVLVVLVGGRIVGLAYMFEKAGEKPWKAVIPFYSLYVLFGIGWKKSKFFFWLSGFAVFIIGFNISSMESLNIFLSEIVFASYPRGLNVSLFPAIVDFLSLAGWIVMIAFQIILSVKIARSFGKGSEYAWGLFFLPTIFYMILGFGNAQYRDSKQALPKMRCDQDIFEDKTERGCVIMSSLSDQGKRNTYNKPKLYHINIKRIFNTFSAALFTIIMYWMIIYTMDKIPYQLDFLVPDHIELLQIFWGGITFVVYIFAQKREKHKNMLLYYISAVLWNTLAMYAVRQDEGLLITGAYIEFFSLTTLGICFGVYFIVLKYLDHKRKRDNTKYGL